MVCYAKNKNDWRAAAGGAREPEKNTHTIQARNPI
jgi:hypothetical protein